MNVLNGAVGMLTGIPAAVVGSIQGLSAILSPVGALAAAQLVRDATVLLNRADDLVQLAAVSGPASDIMISVAGLVEGLDAVLPAEVAASTFAALADLQPVELPVAILAPSDEVALRNEDRLAGAFRRLCLAKYAEAVARTTYPTRAEAVQVRADLVERFYDAILAADHDEDTVRALEACRDNAVQALTVRVTDLTKTLTLETSEALPALYWAGYLYNDATRAQELAERNDLVDWSLLGGAFTAKAS